MNNTTIKSTPKQAPNPPDVLGSFSETSEQNEARRNQPSTNELTEKQEVESDEDAVRLFNNFIFGCF